MTRTGAKHRKDRNHDQVVAIAEAHGWQVVSLAAAGGGVPDLLCWKASHGFRLVEVKDGKRGVMKPAQERFRARYSLPVCDVYTEAEALELFVA